MAMSTAERERRSLAAKRSLALRKPKPGIRRGNPELTRRILESMPREIDALRRAPSVDG
jgi:hypothetical protein